MEISIAVDAVARYWLEARARYRTSWAAGRRFSKSQPSDLCGWLFLARLSPLSVGPDE